MRVLRPMTASITIIMAAYNAAPFIAEAIDSVLAQTRADWSLIIVNDGSTDETPVIVGRYLGDLCAGWRSGLI